MQAPLRSLSYWLEHHPPGWISRHAAQESEPLARASEIHLLAAAFLRWLELPRAERWDTFALQALSAALFNRYRADRRLVSQAAAQDLELLQLSWPAGSEQVQASIARVQGLLAAPFAVYKAVRSALPREAFPTEPELLHADRAIESVQGELRSEVARLGETLRSFAESPAPRRCIGCAVSQLA